MGRRKIEIQPITHERNRSVTFLKRKNGLFKKAYELGVLCSVDVAVIIFEDRPGHDLKLHQYSSSDIREIVQRQIRHQGEKDLKGPADFSGAGGLQFDDKGNGDDDGMDDDDDDTPVRSKKRRSVAKSSMHQDADGDSDYNPPSHRNGNSISHLPPPPMHSSSRIDSASGVGSMLPVSNDRVSSIRDSQTRSSSKRPRSTLDSMDPGRRSPGSEMAISRPPELYLPEQTQPGRFNRQIRHSHNMPPPPNPYHQPEQLQHPSQNFNPNYTPLFPVANQASPPPSFIPLHTDFVPSRNHPGAPSSFVRDMGPPQNSGYGGTSRTRFSNEPQYDPALYPGAIRQQQQTPTSQYPIHSPMHREERVDMFDAFLEAERSRQHGIVPVRGGPGSGLEWPNHEGAPSPPRVGEPVSRGPASMDVSAPVVPQIPHDSNGGDSWFDMFSGANANPGGAAHARSPRQGTSWERGSGTPVGSNVGSGGGPSSIGPRDDPAAGFNSPAIDKPIMRPSDVRSQPSDGTSASGRGSKGASPTQVQDVIMQPPDHTAPVRGDDGGTGAASQASKENNDGGKLSTDANSSNGTAKDGPASDVAA